MAEAFWKKDLALTGSPKKKTCVRVRRVLEPRTNFTEVLAPSRTRIVPEHAVI